MTFPRVRRRAATSPAPAQVSSEPSLSVDEALESLSPQLTALLAGLDGAPESVCQTTVQLLPFGSRAVLEATGIASPGDDIDGLGHRSLVLTPFAFAVIAQAAVNAESGPGDVTDEEWDRRAARVLAPRGTSGTCVERNEQALAEVLASRLG